MDTPVLRTDDREACLALTNCVKLAPLEDSTDQSFALDLAAAQPQLRLLRIHFLLGRLAVGTLLALVRAAEGTAGDAPRMPRCLKPERETEPHDRAPR